MIPVYHADLQQRTDEPFRATDTNMARTSGEAIAAAGKGVTDYGVSMLQRDAARKNQELKLAMDTIDIDSATIAMKVSDATQVNGKPDGSDWEEFSTSLYNKEMEYQLKQYNPEHLPYLRNKIKENEFKLRSELRPKIQAASILALEKKTQYLENKEILQITQDPTKFEQNLARALTRINTSVATDIEKETQTERVRSTYAKIAMEAIKSNAANNPKTVTEVDEAYSEAQKFFLERAGKHLSPKDVEKYNEELVNGRRQTSVRVISEMEKRDKAARAEVERISEMTYEEYAKQIMDISASKADDLSKTKKMDEIIKAMSGNKSMLQEDKDKAMRLYNAKSGEYSDTALAEYKQKIYVTEDLKSLSKAAYKDDRMGGKELVTFEGLLQAELDERARKAKKKGPKNEDAFYKARITKTFETRRGRKDVLLRQEIQTQELYREYRRKGKKEEDAFNAAIFDVTGIDMDKTTSPIINKIKKAKDQETLDKIQKEYIEQSKNLKTPEEKASQVKVWRAIEARKNLGFDVIEKKKGR